MRLGKRRVLHFGILVLAVGALSAAFLLRGTSEDRSVPRHEAVASTSVEGRMAEATMIPSDVVEPSVAPATRTGSSSQGNGHASGTVLAREIDAFPGTNVDESIIQALHGNEPLTMAHPHVAPVREIQKRHRKDLMGHPGVVGTAIGLNDDGQVAIVVMANKDVKDLPSVIEETPVVVWQTGDLFARRWATQQASGKGGNVVAQPGNGNGGGGGKKPKNNSVDPTARFDRPVPIGVSTGHPDITAGTIGCRVTDGADVYALSNNHVYANENNASLGDNALQPGPFDLGINPDDSIATLDAFVPIEFDGSENTVDAAIALTSTSSLGNSTPSNGYGTPRSDVLAAAINKKVQKYGRTTGQTTGKIIAVGADVNVGYDSGTAFFVGQIIIDPGTFSSGGDSGSLIVHAKSTKGRRTDADVRRPVGLLFAGSTTITIANPIGEVLNAFEVTIDGE